MRLIEGGNLNEAVWAIIGQNVRKPVLMLGDLQSQLASLNVGSAAIIRLAERYSTEGLKAAMTQILEQTKNGIRPAGPLPADLQYSFQFTASVATSSKSPEPAREFIRFLASPDSKAVFAAGGAE